MAMTPPVFAVTPVGAIVIVLVDTEHAFYAAEHAAHYSADDCADRELPSATLTS